MTDEEYQRKSREFEQLAGVVKTPVAPRLFIKVDAIKPNQMPATMEDLLRIEKDFQAGKLKARRTLERPGHSWCRNSYNLLGNQMLGTGGLDGGWGDGYLNYRIMNGGSTSAFFSNFYPRVFEATYGEDCVNEFGAGIYIGTGTTAESFDDWELDVPIEHGDATGEMRCWDMWANTISWSAGTRKFTVVIIRYFSNHSGGSITVGEMAFVLAIGTSITPEAYYAVWARDVLSPTWAIADLELIRLQYDIVTIAFPS